MRMRYLGKDIDKDMVIPVLNGYDYDIELRQTPYRNKNGEIKVRLMVYVHELEDDKCIATLPYREDEWEKTPDMHKRLDIER